MGEANYMTLEVPESEEERERGRQEDRETEKERERENLKHSGQSSKMTKRNSKASRICTL